MPPAKHSSTVVLVGIEALIHDISNRKFYSVNFEGQ